MSRVVLFAFTSALNPTLLTATTVMLLLPRPGRLLLGYWLGAMVTSVTLGLIIVFALQGSGAVSTTKRTLSPLADVVLGVLVLLLATVVRSGRDQRVRARRSRPGAPHESPRWLQPLRRGTARTAFVVGAVLTLPGASYLAGLSRLSKLDYSSGVTVLVVLAFNLVMLILLEVPLLASLLAPDRVEGAIERGKAWLAEHGRSYAARGLAVVGVALVAKGVIGLL